MNKKITEYSDLELKAMGFELMSQLTLLQQNLNIITTELNARNQKPAEPVAEEPKA